MDECRKGKVGGGGRREDGSGRWRRDREVNVGGKWGCIGKKGEGGH